MANETLSAIVPNVVAGMNKAGGLGQVGMIRALGNGAMIDIGAVNVGQTVTVPVAVANDATDYTPGIVPATPSGGTAQGISVAITDNKQVEIGGFTNDDEEILKKNGGWDSYSGQKITLAVHKLIRLASAKAVSVAYKGASRAVGTSATTPFATSLTELVSARNILLNDNRSTADNLRFVFDGAAETNLLNLNVIQAANLAGSSDQLRTGVIGEKFGFKFYTDSEIVSHTKGAGTGYDAVAAGEAIGQTTLSLEGGTVNTTGIKAGDVVTFSNHSTVQYVVNTGLTATSGDIVIGKPGLTTALVDATEMTVTESYTPNLAFDAGAIAGIVRAPVIKPTAVLDVTYVVEPTTGIPVAITRFSGYGADIYYAHLAFGFSVVDSSKIVIVKG